MLTSFIRTVLLLVFVILSLRLMGKRQIGQLQPSELVVTILLSQIAATPMQDNDIPLLNTLISIFALTGVEILLSCLSMKSGTVRGLVDGTPVPVIKKGKIDQKALARLRYTVDDLMEGLRQKDVFDVSAVHFAVVETNGNLSVLLKSSCQPLTADAAGKTPKESGVPTVLIKDGKPEKAAFSESGIEEESIKELLRKRGIKTSDVFLLTADETGEIFLVKKEERA